MFEPELPKPKQTSIQKIPIGVVDKIFLQFDKPFWIPGKGHFKLAWPSEEKMKSTELPEWCRKVVSFYEVCDLVHSPCQGKA